MRISIIGFLGGLFGILHAQTASWESSLVQSANTTNHLTTLHQQLGKSVYWVGTGIPALSCFKAFVKKDSLSKRQALCITTGVVSNALVTWMLKEGFKRPRPYEQNLMIQCYDPSADGYSLPSGHASTAFNIATSLSLEYPKWYVLVPTYCYAGWVGFSRIQLGVHYPSDVIIGALIGSGLSWLSWKLEKKIN